MAASPNARALDPAERYFLLLDRLWPMNIVAVAELDRSLDEATVERAWGTLASRRALAGARIPTTGDGDAVLEMGADSRADFAVHQAVSWMEAVQREQSRSFETSRGPLTRCRYLPLSPEHSAIALVIHHSLGDARTVLWLLQELLRELDSAPHREPAADELPPPMHERFRDEHRWLSNKRAMVALLAAIREEQSAAGTPAECPWHERAVPGREPVIDTISLDRAQTSSLVGAARAGGATVQGSLGASWLLAAGELFDDGAPEHTLTLTTPADLRSRLQPPLEERQQGMYITLITGPHQVGGGSQRELAAEVSADVRRRIARGEGELFYALARPEALPIDDRGIARIARAIDSVPQSIAVSNVGVIDDAGDPEWVRSLSFVLAPTPNQVAFVAATTYRGRLTVNACTDRRKLSTADARRLVDGAAGALRDLRR